MNILRLDTADSTNSWIAARREQLQAPSLVYCINQTCGRGQKGNSWESQPGMNITASLYFIPDDFPACRQFEISEGIALAIVEFLKDKGVEAKVKWPNDIYVGDRKICGILVEHVVSGKNIKSTIAGMGININQTEFRSDAPNPVSLRQLTGLNYDIDNCVEDLGRHLDKFLNNLSADDAAHRNFLTKLWRNDGKNHKFFDHKVNEMIQARIVDVALDGRLSLLTDKGQTRDYFFKEIEFIL